MRPTMDKAIQVGAKITVMEITIHDFPGKPIHPVAQEIAEMMMVRCLDQGGAVFITDDWKEF